MSIKRKLDEPSKPIHGRKGQLNLPLSAFRFPAFRFSAFRFPLLKNLAPIAFLASPKPHQSRHTKTAMLDKEKKLAIYMEQSLTSTHGKMGHGVMRYIENPIVCVIDSAHAGKRIRDVCDAPHDYPVVASVKEASDLGAEVLVLGLAPSGGRIPDQWMQPLEQSIRQGMCIVNGLHDQLNERFAGQLQGGQWIWDIRQPGFLPTIASARAAKLDNTRVLLVGTDMTVGKMTAGLEVYRWLQQQGLSTTFVATGQIGNHDYGKRHTTRRL